MCQYHWTVILMSSLVSMAPRWSRQSLRTVMPNVGSRGLLQPLLGGAESIFQDFHKAAEDQTQELVGRIMDEETSTDRLEVDSEKCGFTSTVQAYHDVLKTSTEHSGKPDTAHSDPDEATLNMFEALKASGYDIPCYGAKCNPMAGHWQRACRGYSRLERRTRRGQGQGSKS